MTAAIVASRSCREVRAISGARNPVVGTGSLMLESYRPNVGLSLVRHPSATSGRSCPTSIACEIVVRRGCRLAHWPRSWLASTISAGTSRPRSPHRLGADQGHPQAPTPDAADGGVRRRTPGRTSRCARTRNPSATSGSARRCRWPSIARPSSMRLAEGVGVFNSSVPAAFKDWALPWPKLGEARVTSGTTRRRRGASLAAAGYPSGFSASLCFTSYGSPGRRRLGAARPAISEGRRHRRESRPEREYGAFIASCYPR